MSAQVEPVPVVSLEKVSKIFNGSGIGTTAVWEASLDAYPGELLLLLGPSGSGKTTLLTLAAGLCRPTTGRVRLFGRDIGRYSAVELQRLRAGRIGFIFQNFLLLDSLTAEENVAMVLRFNGCRGGDRRRRALALLQEAGVGALARRFPRTMSQGERQRVAVARAMANTPELVLADEPTGSLETSQGLDIIGLLRRQAGERKACVLVASHDLRLIEAADRVFRLEDGRIRTLSPSSGRRD